MLSIRAVNDRPYTLPSFSLRFVGATIGRPLSHTLPVRWHMTALPSFRMGDYWSPVIPYTSHSGGQWPPLHIFLSSLSFRRGDHWSPVIPYTSHSGGQWPPLHTFPPTPHFVGATIGRPLTIHKNPTIRGCGHILGLFYADNPRLCLYSTGLI